MKQTDRFSLQPNPGPYESWPSRSQLLVDGKLCSIWIPGYTLLFQYEVPGGYLLVTDYDCPYEESFSFVLMSHDLKILSHRRIGAFYGTLKIEKIDWINNRHFLLLTQNNGWKFKIRKWGIPYIYPMLSMSRQPCPK